MFFKLKIDQISKMDKENKRKGHIVPITFRFIHLKKKIIFFLHETKVNGFNGCCEDA